MGRALVRVEAKRLPPNAGRADHMKQLNNMLKAFKRLCNEAGIQADYREHEYFVRKGDKRRQKEAAAALVRRQAEQERGQK